MASMTSRIKTLEAKLHQQSNDIYEKVSIIKYQYLKKGGAFYLMTTIQFIGYVEYFYKIVWQIIIIIHTSIQYSSLNETI